MEFLRLMSLAASLGIALQDIAASLDILVGENYTNRFGLFGRSYDVITPRYSV